MDFEQQSLGDVLVDAGLDAGALTYVTWEGVPMYLTRAAVKATLDAVHERRRPRAASSPTTCGPSSTTPA